LEEFVKKNSINQQIINKLYKLKKNLVKERLLISDLKSRNILVQMDKNCIKRLIVCDGLINSKNFIDTRKFVYTKLLKKIYIKRKFRKLHKELIKISNEKI